MRYILAFLLFTSPAFGQVIPPKMPIKHAEFGRGYVPPTPERKRQLHAIAFQAHGYRHYYQAKNMSAPLTWDSRAMGWIPPIRNQKNCGDCFGVEASDALTIGYIKVGWQKADGSFVISEQYGLDYSNAYQGGCNGGDGPQVYEYMRTTGFPAEKYLDTSGNTINDYPPYTASPGPRRLKPGAKMWGKSDLTWGYVTSDQSDRAPTVDEVKNGIMRYGTVTFAFDAGGLDNMVGNVVRSLGVNIDHEITGFIGWDDNKPCPDGSKGAFISRNQWGASFGDGGYFWLPYTQLRRVVEAAFLTLAILPPPPPPPDPIPPTPPDPPIPPGPTPVIGTTIIINKALAAGEYRVVPKNTEVFPEGTAKAITEQAAKLKAMVDAMNKQLAPDPPPEMKETKEPEKAKTPKEAKAEWWNDQVENVRLPENWTEQQRLDWWKAHAAGYDRNAKQTASALLAEVQRLSARLEAYEKENRKIEKQIADLPMQP